MSPARAALLVVGALAWTACPGPAPDVVSDAGPDALPDAGPSVLPLPGPQADEPPVSVCTACTNAEIQSDPNCRRGRRALAVSASGSNPGVAWISCANSADALPDGGEGRPLECAFSVVSIPGVVSGADLTTRSGTLCQRSGTGDAGWFPYDDGAGLVHMCQLRLPASGNSVTVRLDVRDAVNGRVLPIRDTCTILVNP